MSNFDQCGLPIRPDMARCRANSAACAHLFPVSTQIIDFAWVWHNLRQCLAAADQLWASSAEIGPISAKLGPDLAECVPDSARIGQFRPELALTLVLVPMRRAELPSLEAPSVSAGVPVKYPRG